MDQNVDYESLMKNFDVLTTQIEELKKNMTGESKKFIENAAKSLFEQYPFLHSIYWTQYTPYFNDGDTCEFSVHEICYAFSEQDEEDCFPYDSSAFYTHSDLERALSDLENVKAYQEDRKAWVEAYKKDYKETYGRDWHSFGGNDPQPYPSTIGDAQAKVDTINEFLSGYDKNTMDSFKKDFDSFAKSIARIPEDVMEMLFGDHVSVRIDRNGMEIDEYDHD